MPSDLPTLSLVLAVHGEQAYLEEFVASVQEQGCAGVEIVAIDDASPDHSPDLLDEMAASETRLRVCHLPERVGLGRARTLGLEQAVGEYVWFVHPTDLLPSGSLAALSDRLRAAEPEVLLIHHARVDVLGHEHAGPHRRILKRLAQGDPGPLEVRPRVAGLAPGAWDKVLRRAHLTELGVAFGNGEHGELPVIWPALLTAERIDASASVGYHRRDRQTRVRDRPTRGSLFDVFSQYETVLAFAEDRPLPEPRRALLGDAMLRHQLALLQGVPVSDRRAFFRAVSQSACRQARLSAPAHDGRTARVQAGLVRRDAYHSFRALQAGRGARRAFRRWRKAVALRRHDLIALVQRRRLQRYYRSRLRRPIDPRLAVFAAYWYRGYACNPRAIYERARELAPGMRGVWVVKPGGAAALPPGIEHVVAGSRDYFDVIARARWFINNVNFPNHLVKRPGTVHVMTHHGTPLKYMGLDERHSPVSKTDFKALLERCARWDYSISSNRHSSLVWERVYPLPYETLEVGYPRNDRLVVAEQSDVKSTRAGLGIAPGEIAILYAPTHRDHERNFITRMDLQAVAAALGAGYVLLARRHYFYSSGASLDRVHEHGRVLDVSGHPSVEELCLAADVLVTDYSSIMFDYAVLDRPIVIHAPDWELYRSLRGTYFDLPGEAPGIVTRSEAEVIEAFRSGAVWGEATRESRAAFRARFCSLEDGHAAERVVRRVFLSEEGGLTRPSFESPSR